MKAAMRRNTANFITIIRILCSMILLLLSPLSFVFYLVYTICGLTDIIDGMIARKLHIESAFGSTLDSIADFIFVVVVLVKLVPAIMIPTWLLWWTAAIAFIKVINVVCGFIYAKKFIMLHTMANKMTGLMLFLLTYILDYWDIRYSVVPIYILATFAAIQEGHFIRVEKS